MGHRRRFKRRLGKGLIPEGTRVDPAQWPLGL
jgi:hypothetical protein